MLLRSTTRDDGRPSGVAVARVIAFGSLRPALCASPNHFRNCSNGSACTSSSYTPSHVLKALGLDYRETRSSIRLGFGRYTRQDELVAACRAITQAADAQDPAWT